MTWIVLMHSLPARAGTARVAVWRKLKKVGAQAISTGAVVLPYSKENHEHFTWLAQEIQKASGAAHVVRAAAIEGISDAELRRRFTQACDELYDALIACVRRGEDPGGIRAEAARIDFFGSKKARDLERLLRRPVPPGRRRPRPRGRLWVTRPRPHIDRVACAWLIRRFIDPKARFAFGAVPDGALPFDMPGVEFSHQGEDCSFETLIKRFALRDPTLAVIAEIVHDADLKDDKFGRSEAAGLDAVVRGLTRLHRDDQDVLTAGMGVFDSLYAQLKRR